MQWIKRYWDQNFAGGAYDALGRRKGGGAGGARSAGGMRATGASAGVRRTAAGGGKLYLKYKSKRVNVWIMYSSQHESYYRTCICQ